MNVSDYLRVDTLARNFPAFIEPGVSILCRHTSSSESYPVTAEYSPYTCAAVPYFLDVCIQLSFFPSTR